MSKAKVRIVTADQIQVKFTRSEYATILTALETAAEVEGCERRSSGLYLTLESAFEEALQSYSEPRPPKAS